MQVSPDASHDELGPRNNHGMEETGTSSAVVHTNSEIHGFDYPLGVENHHTNESTSVNISTTLNLYGLDCYSFGTKAVYRVLPEGFKSWHEYQTSDTYAKKLKKRFLERGMRRCVAAVLLVQEHRFPHVLVLHETASGKFSLPHGRLRPGEADADGLKRKLDKLLSNAGVQGDSDSWDIGENISCWYAPDFSMNRYPYIPAHCDSPKEVYNIYVVRLPEKHAFVVPRDLDLMAVPLFQIYQSPERFGPIIASIPVSISGFHFNFLR